MAASSTHIAKGDAADRAGLCIFRLETVLCCDCGIALERAEHSGVSDEAFAAALCARHQVGQYGFTRVDVYTIRSGGSTQADKISSG